MRLWNQCYAIATPKPPMLLLPCTEFPNPSNWSKPPNSLQMHLTFIFIKTKMSVSCSVIKLKFLQGDVWNRTTDSKWYIQKSLCVVCTVVVFFSVVVHFIRRCWHNSCRRVNVNVREWNALQRITPWYIFHISGLGNRIECHLHVQTKATTNDDNCGTFISYCVTVCVQTTSKIKQFFSNLVWFFLGLIAAFPFFKPCLSSTHSLIPSADHSNSDFGDVKTSIANIPLFALASLFVNGSDWVCTWCFFRLLI